MNTHSTDTARRILPYFIEFLKFSTGFAAIISLALLTLHIVSVSVP